MFAQTFDTLNHIGHYFLGPLWIYRIGKIEYSVLRRFLRADFFPEKLLHCLMHRRAGKEVESSIRAFDLIKQPDFLLARSDMGTPEYKEGRGIRKENYI